MKIEALRKLARREEIDYPFLMSALSGYTSPRDKISTWLKTGELVRIKKGLYIFGPKIAQQPYSKEVLANLIYGPSAISLNYALAYYGLIPERSNQVTSITSKRKKLFLTPVGGFTYHYINSEKYSVGIELIDLGLNRTCFMASPEKALCDYIDLIDKKIQINDLKEIEAYLFYDLRIDEHELSTFRIELLKEINLAYRNPKIALLIKFIKQWK